MTDHLRDNVSMSTVSPPSEPRCRPKRFPNIRIVCDDITKLHVDGFVVYAQPDLQLGSGFGGVIRRRGGPDIQKQLDDQAPKQVGEVVLTSAGRLLAQFILHAVGPLLGEPCAEAKLKQVIVNALLLCEKMKAKRIALPAMGTGYYGLPAQACASTMRAAFTACFDQVPHLSELFVCLRDPWTIPLFEEVLSKGFHEETHDA